MIICDIVYFTLNKKLISTVFDSKNLKIQFGIFTWSIMAFSLYYFIMRNRNWTLKKKIKNASILGFCIYGIYNFTNLSVFNFWNLKLAIVDTLWGSFLFGFVVFLIESINKVYKLY